MAFFNKTLIPRSFFFIFLLSSASSTAPPPPFSAHAAADELRNRGYSVFASTIDSTNKNFSGTILAPPDFIFSAKILSNLPSPPRPSTILLRYHTLNTSLTWVNLLSNVNGAEIPTLYNNNCLFFFKSSNGEISISSTGNNSIGVVNIRQPDIYVDDHLTVHGIDGVLDPTSAKECSVPEVQTTSIIQSPDHRSFLDHAIRALRRRRFTVAATALAIKRPELLSLSSVSVFAPSDMSLFANPDGFRYDYRHHVVPKRYRFGNLARNGKGATVVFETLSPKKKLVVNYVDGFVTVNSVRVNSTEVYRNRWIVVFSVSMSLDDAGDLLDSSYFAPSPATATMEIRYPDEISRFNVSGQSPSPATMDIHYPDERINGSVASVQSPSPAKMDVRYPERINGSTTRIPSPSPDKMEIRYSNDRINGFNASVQSPGPATMYIESPSPATMQSNVNDPQCVFRIPAGMEGGDLLCPAIRHLQEEDLIEEHVAHYEPLDVKDQLAEDVNQSPPLISNVFNQHHQGHINIADDLFFYF
ncbi:hypothetical protein P3S68_023546 [Capsicum galapagoense]